MTIGGVAPQDERLQRAIPDRAKSRQITALDKEPTRPFPFVSPITNTNDSAQLNAEQVASIGATLRDLGVAPNSFAWAPSPAGPYPGLSPLMEGDEALFFGRDIEIRNGLKALEELRATVTRRAFVIQAPSGAGKSSFLRAGLWRRLRRHAAFTPLAIIRVAKGAVHNKEWGLVTGLFDTIMRSERIARRLSCDRDEIEDRASTDLTRLLAEIADADASKTGRRTLLFGIDQAEEMTRLSPDEDVEFDYLLRVLLGSPGDLDLRLVLAARDDGVDAIFSRLARAGLPPDKVETWRLHRLPVTRFDDIILGPAKVAQRAGWPLAIDPALVDALVAAAAGDDAGEALPILALALQRMVAKRRTPDGRITLKPQDAVSFVEGAVSDAAAEALAKTGKSQDDLRRLVIPCLATWDPRAGSEGGARRQIASAASLFADDRADLLTLADAFVDQHLLTRSKTDAGSAYEVAHDALLHVAPLRELMFERREKFERARILEIEARDWLASESSEDRLGRSGERLREARDLLADPDFGPELLRREPHVADYLDACREFEREQIDKRRRIIGRAFVKPALQALEVGAIEPALRLAAAGWLLADDLDFELVPELWGPAERAIFDNKTQTVLRGHIGPVGVSSFSPDGRRIVTASDDNTARVWDSETGEEIVLLKAHSGSVYSASFSPDGRRIVTASADNTARLWDAESGKEIAQLKAHSGKVWTASFSPDGRRMATASFDATARVWDTESGEEIVLLKAHSGSVYSVSFSPDGRRIVTASADNTARLWDAESGKGIALLKAHSGSVYGVSFSPDGCQVVTASADKTARLWDAESGKENALLEAHAETVWSVSFSPDGRWIVTASVDNTARVWNAESGKQIALLKGHLGWVYGASFSPDGRRIVTASVDGSARVWDAKSGKEISLLQAHAGGVRGASFSPDGRRIVTASVDGSARVWGAESGQAIALLKAHSGWVWNASFSPDGRRIATASFDATARVWDAESGKEIVLLKAHSGSVYSASFSPDGRRIVTASADNTARLWDAESGKEIAQLKAHSGKVWTASFSPDGRRIVTASSDHTARVWDAECGKEIALLKAHSGSVYGASFSPDGRWIVTASSDDTARVWDAESGEEIALLKAHSGSVYGVSFSPDGRQIATASWDNTARVWDAESGREIALLKAHTETVWSALFSPDGRRIVTASDDSTARVWDAESGKQIALLEAPMGAVRSASFSPDGRRIVTASFDATARVWDAESGKEIALLKAHLLPVNSASFSPDGRWIVTASTDATARVWDVSRTEAIASERPALLTAALGRGIGWRTEVEAADLLMQDAPEDMFAEAVARLGDRSSVVSNLVAKLRAPLHSSCYLSPTQFAERVRRGGDRQASSRAARILVVEDELWILQMVSEELDVEGFSVLRAETGEVALSIIKSGQVVDVLFTDIRLPGELDGWELAATAREAKPELPVIYTSAYYELEKKKAVPGSVFLEKPYLPSAIVKTIRTLLPTLNGKGYLEARDAISAWIDDCCERDPQAWETRADLWRSWSAWALKEGELEGSKKNFYQRLEAHGYPQQRRHAERGFCGLKFR